MRVLITGSTSLLGKALWGKAPKDTVILLTHPLQNKPTQTKFKTATMDITDKDAVKRVLSRFKPDWIIHLAAISDVDFCESNKLQAYAANVLGTKNLANIARKVGARFLFTSSNGIFDGKHAPYTERSNPHPLHVYGKTKLEAERVILRSKIPSLIIRPITMYGWPPEGARQNPVTWALEQLKKGMILNMVTDSFVNPLYAPSGAEAIWKLIKADAHGLYHVAGKTSVSRYAWTVQIAKTFGFRPSLIQPVKSSFFPSLAHRPRDSSFSTAKLEQAIDWSPLTLKDGLTRMKREKKQAFYC